MNPIIFPSAWVNSRSDFVLRTRLGNSAKLGLKIYLLSHPTPCGWLDIYIYDAYKRSLGVISLAIGAKALDCVIAVRQFSNSSRAFRLIHLVKDKNPLFRQLLIK